MKNIFLPYDYLTPPPPKKKKEKRKKDADDLVSKILSKIKDWLQNPRFFELNGLLKNDLC